MHAFAPAALRRAALRLAATLLGLLAVGLSCEPGIVTAPGEATSVRAGPRGATIEVGDSTRLSAAAMDRTGSGLLAGRTVQWSSDQPGVARVDAAGWVRGISPGSALLRASVDGHADTLTVVVVPPAVRALRLTSDTATVIRGQTRQLVAATYGRRDTLLTGRAVAWASSAAAVASVSGIGVVTAHELGTALIIASSEGHADTASVVVVPVPVKRLVVTPNPALVQLGTTLQLVADPQDSTGASLAGRPVGWSATNAAIAGIGAATGLLTGAAVGQASVTATSEGVVTTVPVTVAVPVIGVSRTTVAMTDRATGSNPPPEAVTIANAGPFTLSGLGRTITYGAGASGWLAAALNQAAAPATLTLQATTGSLAPGTYTATVAVTSSVQGVAPVSIGVTFTVVPQPQIGLSHTAPSFGAEASGADPAPLDVQVSNAGTGTLSGLARAVAYTAGQPTGWLEATLAATTAPTTLRLQPRVAGLAIGTYTATVEVTSPLAGVVPRTIAVTFNVAQGPTIGLSVSSVPLGATAFSTTPATATVDVSNVGSGTLAGLDRSIAYGPGASGWLTAQLAAGSAPTTLALSASAAALGAGTYTATVTVTSTSPGAAPRALAVTFTVGSQPVIAVAPPSATFDVTRGAALPAPQNLQVTNTGGGTLTGLARTVAYGPGATGWLTSSVGANAPATLALQPNTTSLAAGTYTATVTLTSTVPGVASRDVPVTLVVRQPQIGLATTTVALGDRTRGIDVPSTSIVVSNAGEGTLTGLAAQSDAAWVTPVIGGSLPTSLVLQYNILNLAVGSHSATVTVSSSLPGVAPRQVAVTVTVQQPQIALSATTLDYTLIVGDNRSDVFVDVTNGGTGTLGALRVGTLVYSAGATGWSGAQLTATVAPTTLRIQVQPSFIPSAGTYSVTIPVLSDLPGVTARMVTVNITLRWSFSRHIAGLMAGCAGCHTGGEDMRVRSNLVNVVATRSCTSYTRVVPGRSDLSLLYLKLATTSPPCGSHMRFGTAFTADATTTAQNVQRVREWIDGGAEP